MFQFAKNVGLPEGNFVNVRLWEFLKHHFQVLLEIEKKHCKHLGFLIVSRRVTHIWRIHFFQIFIAHCQS